MMISSSNTFDARNLKTPRMDNVARSLTELTPHGSSVALGGQVT